MVHDVFTDTKRLSIEGYLPRMRRSFGILYLGRDPGPDYDSESEECNEAIMDLDQHSDVHPGASIGQRRRCKNSSEKAKDDATHDGQTSWDLTIDARELIDPLLADFCEEWFGLSEGGYKAISGAPAIAGIGSRASPELSRPFSLAVALYLPAASRTHRGEVSARLTALPCKPRCSVF